MSNAIYAQSFGTANENIAIPFVSDINPGYSDVNFPLGKRWINTLTNAVYSLSSIQNNIATWLSLNYIYEISYSAYAIISGGSGFISNVNIHPNSIILVYAKTSDGNPGVGNVSISSVMEGSFILTVSDYTSSITIYSYTIINIIGAT